MRLSGARVAVFSMSAMAAFPVNAQEAASSFPSRVVSLVVPALPGASFDVTARMYAQKLSDSLRQPIVLEHRPGAGGTIA